MGMRKVRIANLPPEVPDVVIRTVLSSYRELKDVQTETLSRSYRYPVANGTRIATITLAKHIPSHITMVGNRVLVSYEGQPMTCYGCNGTSHFYHACPMRRRKEEKAPTAHATSWANNEANVDGGTGKDSEVAECGAKHNIQTELTAKNYENVREEHSGDGGLISPPRRSDNCSTHPGWERYATVNPR
jgi:hypothetical protein